MVSAMVERVRELDPAFFERVGEGPLEGDDVVEPRCRPTRTRTATRRPRASTRLLGSRTSLLVDYTRAGRGDDGGRRARGARGDAGRRSPTTRRSSGR